MKIPAISMSPLMFEAIAGAIAFVIPPGWSGRSMAAAGEADAARALAAAVEEWEDEGGSLAPSKAPRAKLPR